MNVYTLPVFPAADVFPMMADDELAELAEDIKVNGLRDPIVIADIPDENGELIETLIDGRNRRKACKKAGVEPSTRKLDGEDPTAFVLSANIHRRHLTRGQRAMAVAMIYPEPRKTGRGRKSSVSEDISATRLSMARTVLRYSIEGDFANDVLAGASLDEKYKAARERCEAPSEAAQIEALRARYPNLADMAVEGELTLEGARAEAGARDEKLKQRRETACQVIEDAVFNISAFNSEEFVTDLTAWLEDADFKRTLQTRAFRQTPMPSASPTSSPHDLRYLSSSTESSTASSFLRDTGHFPLIL